MQDDIVERIVTHMLPGMVRAEAQQATRRRPASLGAWDLFQRGCWHFNRLSEADNGQARDFFEKSLEIDPMFSSASAYIATTHAFDAAFGWSQDAARSVTEGIKAAQHAIALDPKEPLAHAVLASLYVFNREPERGVEEGKRAVEINPYFGTAHMAIGNALVFAGRPEEAIEPLHKGLGLSPCDEPTISVVWSTLALAHLLINDYDTAVEYGRKALADNAANFRAGHRLACALAHQGDTEGAKAVFEISKQHMPEPTLAYFEATYPFSNRDMLDVILDGLRKAGWDG